MSTRICVFLIFVLALVATTAGASERYDIEAKKTKAYDGYLNSVRLPGSTVRSGNNSASDWSSNFSVLPSYELVNDYIGLLSIKQEIEIKRKLQRLERDNGTQIVVLTVPHTSGLNAFEYGKGIYAKWDIGNNGEKNGVLLVISGDGGTAIKTGEGSAGALPDLECFRIIRSIILPNLRDEKYFEAINEAVDAIVENFKKENSSPTWYQYLLFDSFSSVMSLSEIIKYNSDKFISIALVFIGILWLLYGFYAGWKRSRSND